MIWFPPVAISRGAGISAEGRTFDAFRTESYTFKGLDGLKAVLDKPFLQQGFAVSMSIAPANGGGHAITCWGYETDDAGNLCALYITDSDDKQYGARRMAAKADANGQVHLYGDNPLGSYGDGSYMIYAVNYLTATTAVTKTANNSLADAITASTDSTVTISTATEARGSVSTTKGIVLEEGSMLISSGTANNNNITLGTQYGSNTGTGIYAMKGSLLDIRNATLKVYSYTERGIVVETEGYIAMSDVTVSRNTGSGIYVLNTMSDKNVYLGLVDNGSVYIGYNKDSGIYVSGSGSSPNALNSKSYNALVEIAGNQKVEFYYNTTSKKGGAIRSSGDLRICNNGEVIFTLNQSTGLASANGGGAISIPIETTNGGSHAGTAVISGNKSVKFDYNSTTSYGGAIETAGSLRIEKKRQRRL